jgi:hypothetical protein
VSALSGGLASVGVRKDGDQLVLLDLSRYS